MQMYFQTVGAWVFRELVVGGGGKEGVALLFGFFTVLSVRCLGAPVLEEHPGDRHGIASLALPSCSLPQDPLTLQLACIAVLWCFAACGETAVTWAGERSEHGLYSGAKEAVLCKRYGTLCPESWKSRGPGCQTNRLVWIWWSGRAWHCKHSQLLHF